MPDVDNIGQVHSLAQRIIDELSEPFTLFGSDAWSGASIGLALAPEDGVDRLELMRKADIALYEAKSGGRGTYRQFERAMDESVRTRQTIAADLRTALHNRHGLEVWYQPADGYWWSADGGHRSAAALAPSSPRPDCAR